MSVAFWCRVTSMQGAAGSASSSIPTTMLSIMDRLLHLLARSGELVTIDIPVSKPLAKAIGARRQTQRHLDRLTQRIAASAGRQAITVKARSREQSLSGLRVYRPALADRLAFESWGELDALHQAWRRKSRSSARSSIAAMRQFCPRERGEPRMGCALGGFWSSCSQDISQGGGLGHLALPASMWQRPSAGLPFFSLRSEPAAGRFKAACAPRGGRFSLSARGQARGPRR